jgi:hypothetical protein
MSAAVSNMVLGSLNNEAPISLITVLIKQRQRQILSFWPLRIDPEEADDGDTRERPSQRKPFG